MNLRISLGELIAAVPVLMDASPHECVVVVGISPASLPEFALTIPREVLLDPARASVTAAAVAEELACEGVDVALLISYTDDDVREGCAALETLRLEVEFSVPHTELVAVKENRWFRPGCFDPECCGELGRQLAPVPPALPGIFAQARAAAAKATTVSRAALERAALRLEARGRAAARWEDALAEGAVADAATARALAAALDDLCVRDWLVLTILGAEAEAAEDALSGVQSSAVGAALDGAITGLLVPDPLAVERARAVVERVARAARGRGRRASTLTVMAVLDWWEGNLAAAAERCDGALDAVRGYRLAELVRIAATRGIAPGWMAQTGQKVP